MKSGLEDGSSDRDVAPAHGDMDKGTRHMYRRRGVLVHAPSPATP